MRLISVTLIAFFTSIFTAPVQAQDETFLPIGNHSHSFYELKKVWNPEWFQGSKKHKNYFEGWYFKMISADGKHRYAFIPGISLGKDSHAFVQVVDGQTGKTQYHRYNIDEFYYSSSRFAVWVGPNFFSADSFFVELGKGNDLILGKSIIEKRVEYPVKPFSPGIMGWYRFVPFMECFHGVVSIDHALSGDFLINNKIVSFNNGKGYIEKDWGVSMPSAWVWAQSNNFEGTPDASFMLSVANVPWMGGSFTGFLGYLYANGQLYRFATYTGAEIKTFETEGDNIRIVVELKRFTIEFQGNKGIRGELLAPVDGIMERTIHESIDASIIVKLWDKSKNLLFEGFAPIAGLEMVGDVKGLNPMN